MKNFMQAALAGEFTDLQIELDYAITGWHNGASTLELYDYLGMTWDEYKQVVEYLKTLNSIILERKPIDKSTIDYIYTLNEGQILISRSDNEPMNSSGWESIDAGVFLKRS